MQAPRAAILAEGDRADGLASAVVYFHLLRLRLQQHLSLHRGVPQYMLDVSNVRREGGYLERFAAAIRHIFTHKANFHCDCVGTRVICHLRLAALRQRKLQTDCSCRCWVSADGKQLQQPAPMRLLPSLLCPAAPFLLTTLLVASRLGTFWLAHMRQKHRSMES